MPESIKILKIVEFQFIINENHENPKVLREIHENHWNPIILHGNHENLVNHEMSYEK